MANILNTTQIFVGADVVTHTNLNNIISGSSFVAGVGGATDDVSLEVDSTGGFLQIKDDGVTTDKIINDAITFDKIAQGVLDKIYPIGSIYSNADDNTNPNTLLGFGTWDPFGEGKVVIGIDSTDPDFDIVGSGTNTNGTTGEKTHTLTLDELPAHDHVPNRNTYDTNNILMRRASNGNSSPGSTDTTIGEIQLYGTNAYDLPVIQGNDDPHNNLQPYTVVYMWKRIS